MARKGTNVSSQHTINHLEVKLRHRERELNRQNTKLQYREQTLTKRRTKLHLREQELTNRQSQLNLREQEVTDLQNKSKLRKQLHHLMSRLRDSHHIPESSYRIVEERLIVAFGTPTLPNSAPIDPRTISRSHLAGQEIYADIRNTSPSLFLGFLMAISPNECRKHKSYFRAKEFLKAHPSFKPYKITLDPQTLRVLSTWGLKHGFHAKVEFVDFIESVTSRGKDLPFSIVI